MTTPRRRARALALIAAPPEVSLKILSKSRRVTASTVEERCGSLYSARVSRLLGSSSLSRKPEKVPHDCVSWTNLFPSGVCDPVTSVMPDWDGRIWWVTRLGRVGT
ncbi:hypothetical protein EAO71_36045, partial [Streptomyces sp. ms191]